jgi:hypothetical protein
MPRSPNASSSCHLNHKTATLFSAIVATGDQPRAGHRGVKLRIGTLFLSRDSDEKTQIRNKTFVVDRESHVQANLLKLSEHHAAGRK